MPSTLNVAQIKQTISVAKELRENIAALEKIEFGDTTKPLVEQLYADQAKLVYEFDDALSVVQWDELQNSTDSSFQEAVQRVANFANQMKQTLSVITHLHNPIEETGMYYFRFLKYFLFNSSRNLNENCFLLY